MNGSIGRVLNPPRLSPHDSGTEDVELDGEATHWQQLQSEDRRRPAKTQPTIKQNYSLGLFAERKGSPCQ